MSLKNLLMFDLLRAIQNIGISTPAWFLFYGPRNHVTYSRVASGKSIAKVCD